MMKIAGVIILALLLSGCTLWGGEKEAEQSSPPPAVSDAEAALTPVPTTVTAELEPFHTEQAIHIGKSDQGDVYEAFGHLYLFGADQQAVEIGDPAVPKRGAKLSKDGSVIAYQFMDTTNLSSPLAIALHAIDTDKVTVLDTYSHLPVLGDHLWVGDQVLVMNASQSHAPVFAMYSGSTGERTRTGQVFQRLQGTDIQSSYLLRFDPPEELESTVSKDYPITISVLTSDGALHDLLKESFYETQFLDVRLSEDRSAIAVWTHLVPDNSSQLMLAAVDPATWKTGEWQTYKTAPKKEGFIRFHTDRQIVLLSNEQSFRLPSPIDPS
ncbi:hypothetical protein D3P07_01560 [Paenibacillus sp. 1011MAR3C5]|uniref:hypothetical protein n=1 Tax=Paenibacillus sp. 1011MAR3C5 TaxID=1675787 RepID=UPI000E6CAEC8|nr:hypothetical protein [Paenibacillus sp. 1011MAR3C5]RJE90811.1 hypothetical protein D3P07_01560 [Paenibacillus sp. 1011MAR3C5]